MARNNSAALVKGFQIFTGDPHMVKRVSCDNTGAAVAYLMLFDSSTTPAEGSVPDFEKLVAASGTVELVFDQQGERFAKGLYAVLSTTPAVLATVGTAIGWFQATFQ